MYFYIIITYVCFLYLFLNRYNPCHRPLKCRYHIKKSGNMRPTHILHQFQISPHLLMHIPISLETLPRSISSHYTITNINALKTFKGPGWESQVTLCYYDKENWLQPTGVDFIGLSERFNLQMPIIKKFNRNIIICLWRIDMVFFQSKKNRKFHILCTPWDQVDIVYFFIVLHAQG